MSLENLLEMSHRYGSNEDYVLAGGGNTSFKDDRTMYVKGSGTQLATMTTDQFVAMDLQLLRDLIATRFSPDVSEEDREAKTLAAMMAARLPGEETKRPSVEAILHAIFPYKLVLHVHPALVNGLTCGIDGEAIFSQLFGEKAVWVGLTQPGLGLAQECNRLFEEYTTRHGSYPQIVILKNHGIFIAADTLGEVDQLMAFSMDTLKRSVKEFPDFSDVSYDVDTVCAIAPVLRMLNSNDGISVSVFCTNKTVASFVSDAEAFKPLLRPFTPDHIVYYKDEPLFIEADADIAAAFLAYDKRKGFKPRIVAVKGLGFFALGSDRKAAERARILFLDAVKIATYSRSFGGASPLPVEFVDFILNWEVEGYRTRVISSGGLTGRLTGRIAVVTGGAQGFGKGIAESMAAEGAYISVADLNLDGALACAGELNAKFGAGTAIAVKADVSDESSVRSMIQETVLAFGGLDVLVSNAGILIAGSISDLSKESFDLVTKVNYSGYFLCTKYAIEPMKIQNRYAPGYMMDIIEINSKSGLEGSNKNAAYAGSKFGGIGLTQSFAMELVEYGIKVNAICPGNLLDGPLWSDPERGLFRQYLDSGKVAGAKTLDDVRKFYEAKVPLGRGCTTDDVACAIMYAIEQKYETGQAIPVTGGQVMLK